MRSDPLDIDALDGLLPQIRDGAAEVMVEALIEAESRQTRRVLLDRLRQLGARVAPLAVARLADPRWYVQRNMLAIIGQLSGIPDGFNVGDFFEHPDERVRREALRIMFSHQELRERAVCRAISDTDPRTVRMGLAAASEDCPKAAVSLVISRATAGEGSEERVAAIKVLGSVREAAALDVLLNLAQPKRTLFGARLPPKTPMLLEVLRALRRHENDGRAAAVVALAKRSKDPDILKAAGVAALPR